MSRKYQRNRVSRVIRGPLWRMVHFAARVLKRKAREYDPDKWLGDLYVKRKAAGELDRAQWRRWYKANKRHQRQLAAWKRLGGRYIDPRSTGIPRVLIP